VLRPVGHRLAFDADTIETPFGPLQSTIPGSPTIDMLSLSSDSEHVGRRDLNSFGFSFFKKLFGRILVVYQAGSNQAYGQGSGTTTSAASGSSPSSLVPTWIQSRKRNRLVGSTPPGEEDDDHEMPKTKRAKKEQPDCQSPRCFACPFYKLDSTKHWECILKKITSISYVKQHLLRRHTPEFYCHRCYAIFPDAQTYDQHVLQASCFRDESAKLEGITQNQSRQLSKKVTGSVEIQWLAMWKVLFPDDPPPASIYVDSVDLGLVREFGRREGVGILRDTLRSSGLLLRPGVSESELERVLEVGLEAMFEYFRLNNQSASQWGTVPLPSTSSGQQESAPAHFRLSQQRDAGDGSSDSAVAMQNYSPESSFSSPFRPGNLTQPSFPPVSGWSHSPRPSMAEVAGSSRLLTNLRQTRNGSNSGAEGRDLTFPTAFRPGLRFTGQLNDPMGGPFPSDSTGTDDGGPDPGASGEARGADVSEWSESLGDGQSDWPSWENLGNPELADVNLGEILKGIVDDDCLLQRSLEWEDEARKGCQ